MKTTHISTSALSEATRLSLVKLQAKLAQAQKEVTTGRLADVGLTLGYQTGQTISLRQDHARLQAITDTNAVTATRLDASQSSLQALAETSQKFLDQLMAPAPPPKAGNCCRPRRDLPCRCSRTCSTPASTAPRCSPASTPT